MFSQASATAGLGDARTRDRVRVVVGERGPITARAISEALNLTPAAVRRHLDSLAHEGVIAERETAPTKRRGRGRPARHYVLTDVGQEQLSTSYDGVATSAIRYLHEVAGAGAVDGFAEQHISELEARLRPAVEAAGDDLAARTAALAQALSEEGFAASNRPVGQGTGLAGIQLCQGHCPMRHVAAEFRQFCDAETEAISRLLGVHVQRLATLASGEHVCTTFVPTGALTQAPITVPDREQRRAGTKPTTITRIPTRTERASQR